MRRYIILLQNLTFCGILGLTGACSLGNVDDLQGRAAVVNNNMAEYSNNAIALNILRAIDRAPLNFAQLIQVQGHNSLNGSLGVPSVTFGPHLPTNPRAYTIGPNTISRSFSTDFTVNAIDDPNTYAALFSPIDSKTIGLLMQQGYPREVIFMLFIDRIRIRSHKSGRWISYNNDPLPETTTYPEFLRIIYALIESGIVVQTLNTSNSGGQGVGDKSKTTTKLCLDRSAATSLPKADLYVASFFDDVSPAQARYPKIKRNGREVLILNDLKNFSDHWRRLSANLAAYNFWADNSSAGKKEPVVGCGYSSSKVESTFPASTAGKGSITAKKSSTKDTSEVSVVWQDGKLRGDDSEKGYAEKTVGVETISFDDGLEIQFVYRSAYSAYFFLGELGGGKDGESYTVPIFSVVQKDQDQQAVDDNGILLSDLSPAPLRDNSGKMNGFDTIVPRGYVDARNRSILNLTPDTTSLMQINRVTMQSPNPRCFVRVEYGQNNWCVAETAKTSKLVFGMLHQLVQYYSSPSTLGNNTLSVRPVQ
jgi:hypothetical protein